MFLGILVLLILLSIPIGCCSGEFDSTTVVSSVTDGDTFDTTSDETIRLADVDAPETYEVGYQASKDYLISLIYGKTVYLDIDSLYVTDYYGTGDRLVCVAYINYNSTHYLNVNQALVKQGYALSIEFENDFNPDNWTLYIPKQDIPEFPSWTILLLFTSVTLSAIIVRKKLRKDMFQN